MSAPTSRRAFGLTAVLLGAAIGLAPGSAGHTARPTTSCEAVVHIGDSLSVGLVSDSYLPDEQAQIDDQYRQVGVGDVHLEISGARSVVEHLDGQLAGEQVARKVRRNGFHGCWVVALGTNDAANVAVGSASGYSDRIDRMMAIIGDDPVVWIDVKTLRERGPYAGQNMRRFNQALAKAHARYPELQVYDWSRVVADQWFDGDGIHYNSDGYAYRSVLIASALAEAFPGLTEPLRSRRRARIVSIIRRMPSDVRCMAS